MRPGKRKYNNRISVLVICMVLLLLAGVFVVNGVSLYRNNQELAQKEETLHAWKDAEEQRSQELQELEAYMKTDEYVEDVARERFGLVYPDESVHTE